MSETERLQARYGAAYRWLATGTALMGTISTILSATIVNVAIPDVIGAFGMTQNQAQWLATAFLAAMTVLMPCNAWLVARFGVRQCFTAAMGVFLLGSILGGISPGSGVLVLGRVLQGAAAGVSQPLAMLIIFSVFPAEKRGEAMGIYGIGVILAPALGPALGGVLIDQFSWRYVFFMALPFAATGIVLAQLFLPRREGTEAGRFDALGFALLSTALLLLLVGLSNGQRDGWGSLQIALLLAGALAATLAFVLWERRRDTPLLDLSLFGNRHFLPGALVTLILGAGLYGSTYLIPLFVQTLQGYTPTRSGLLLMPAGLVLALVFPLAGRLSDRFSKAQLTAAGLLLFALSAQLMRAVDANTPFWTFAGWILLGRIGLGLIMPALTAGALQSLTPAQLGQGAGAINFLRQLGGAVGVNGLAVVLERQTALHAALLANTQTAGNRALTAVQVHLGEIWQQAGLAGDVASGMTAHWLGQMLQAQASALAFRDSFALVALLFALAVGPALMLRHSPPPSPEGRPERLPVRG